MTETYTTYKFDELSKYQKSNIYIIPELSQFCVNVDLHHTLKLSNYNSIMNDIITSFNTGCNSNNMLFRNDVKTFINIINQNNYDEYINKLKKLNYTSVADVDYLFTELIMCAIRCPIAVKGFTFQEDSKYKSIPEICADAIKYFSLIEIETESITLNFKGQIMKICQRMFAEFIDPSKSLDEHNENTADNYKGFMTLIGLLYARGLLSPKIILDCLIKIKKLIFSHECDTKNKNDLSKHSCFEHNKQIATILGSSTISNICYHDCNKLTGVYCGMSSRKQSECANLYKGYEFLLNHTINYINTKITELNPTDQEIYEKISEFVNDLIINHQDFITFNVLYKAQFKTQFVNPLKSYNIISNNNIGLTINKIQDKLSTVCDKYKTRYIPSAKL